MAGQKFNVYQAVTDRIVEQLKQGEIPWHKPWTGIAGGAFNRVSKKPYSLLNQMMLKHEGEYATFKQWSDLGGKIKKGEKSEIVVFWKILNVTEKNDKGEDERKSIPLLKYINVFHVSQVEGVEPLSIKPVDHEPIVEAEKIKVDYMERENLRIDEVVSNRAYYSPVTDRIVVPCKEQYTDVNEFYATLFHEMTHSSGAKHRLNRFGNDTKLAAFGSSDYSKEELVAELGASFLMSHVGIESDKTLKNSAAYIQGWLAALANDNKLIVSAASKAEKATKFILGEETNTVAA